MGDNTTVKKSKYSLASSNSNPNSPISSLINRYPPPKIDTNPFGAAKKKKARHMAAVDMAKIKSKALKEAETAFQTW